MVRRYSLSSIHIPIMKRKYCTPSLRTYCADTTTHLLSESFKIESDEKVRNTSDIGFVKEQRSDDNFWGGSRW